MMFPKKKTDESKYKIMIVEDDKRELIELRELLKDSYEIISASNSHEALQYIQAMEEPNEISVIICDQRMPGFTGIEFLSKINEKKLMPNTKFILNTGVADKVTMIAAINKAHIYFFIEKPIDPIKFPLKVEEAVETYAMSLANDNLKN